ncbi:P-II family nitrogen regulator [Telmatobacter bradus]|uniref:P-II family nitrogen regulator n=1 Tax=Telmatobacter bradus TaxID=474953 RepID=UPI003B43A254
MKEVIAIVRPKKVGPTRNALVELGFPGMTATAVLGRGRQRGIAGEVNFIDGAKEKGEQPKSGMKYIPKRMLSVIVPSGDVKAVINAIIKVNQTGQIGDGKVFVCPIEDALRVRTGEQGEKAVL